MTGYVPLDVQDLAIAASLLIVNGILSFAFGLNLERSFFIASIRMIVQLAIVAMALKLIFELNEPIWTVIFALVMATAAAYEVTFRQEKRVAGKLAVLLGALAPFLSGLVATLFAVGVIVEPEPWYAPRYVLPIFGMMLGNALTGTSLVLNTLTQGMEQQRVAVETRLALGASRFEALDGILRHALTTGLMPILTAMAATGIVSLPGMMTGQILAGVEPVAAAKYQAMIMFLIAGSTAISVVAAAVGAILLLTDERHRLRLDRLKRGGLRHGLLKRVGAARRMARR